MANTGFISVAPELAALQADITAIMGPTWNPATDGLDEIARWNMGAYTSVIVIEATLIPALEAEHAALAAEHVVIDDVVDAIRATDITTITDAITAKVVRGAFTETYYGVAPGDNLYHIIINEVGSGKIHSVNAKTITTNGTLRITIDGEVSNELNITAGTDYSIVRSNQATGFYIKTDLDFKIGYLNMEYKNTLLIEMKQSNGANLIQISTIYNID